MTAAVGQRIEGARREELRQRLQSLGFDAVRFVAVGSDNTSLSTWLGAGNHAEMKWMERSADKRRRADLVLPGAKTVVVLGVNYWQKEPIKNRESGIENIRWARYALHEDYHDTMKPGLVAAGRVLEEFGGGASDDYRYYVDTGPVLERGWAARSGLGFRGKNAMLISKEYGNWLFLASILARLEIEPDRPLRDSSQDDAGDERAGLLCGKCTRCLDACPTNAFSAPGIVDARRCISYQTIENKGVIPRELRAGIGARIYGCDICLEVCPWNRFAQQGRQLLLAARPGIAALTLSEILALTPARFAEVFRGTAIKRLKLVGLLRNACVVAGNLGSRDLLASILPLVSHESAVVRAHAVWAVQNLAGKEAAALLAETRATESDLLVLAEYAVV